MAKYFLRLGEREIEAELEETPEGPRVNIEGTWQSVGLQRIANSPRYVLTLGDRILEVLVDEGTQGFALQIAGRTFDVETTRSRRKQDEGEQIRDGRWILRAPLTGVVVEVKIEQGQTVAQGDVLLVVEAMKMLNELRARAAGVVTALNVEKGQRVEIGAEMLVVTVEETAQETTEPPAP